MSAINATIRENLSSLGSRFEVYWKLTRKSRAEALAYTAKNFSIFSVRRLKGIQLAKGAITKERLAGFKSGEGLRISDRAREIVSKKYGARQKVSFSGGTVSRGRMITPGVTKRQQAEVQRLDSATGNRGISTQALLAAQELRLRESHRAFTTSSVRFRGDMKQTTFSMQKGRQTGRAKPVSKGAELDEYHFEWSSQIGRFAAMAATGLGHQKARTSFADALVDTRRDMDVYIARKQQEAARAAARSVR